MPGRKELTLVASDGQQLPVLASASTIHDGTTVICLVVSDLTERKQVEARILAINAQLEDRVAKRTAELEQQGAALAAANEELQASNEEIRAANEELQTAEEELAAPNQQLQQSQQALRERERLLQDVIDGSPSPIFLKDLDGKFITVNSALEKMLGMSRQQLKGKTDYDIAPKDQADYWRNHDRKVIETAKAIQIEERADLPDGHHWFLANKFPLVNASGKVYGVGAMSHDITDRKRTRRRWVKANADTAPSSMG